MSTHHISNANTLTWGDAYTPGAQKGHRGVPFHPVTLVSLGAPLGVDGNGLAADIALDDGIAAELDTRLDVPRNVTVTPAGDDSGISYTVRGTDQYGASMSETIAGANATKVEGAKAFSMVTSVTANGAPATTVDIGWGRAFGLPYAVHGGHQILVKFADDLPDAGTLVTADATDPGDATGDVRGTYNPGTTPDGSVAFHLYVAVDQSNAYGRKPA